MKRLLIEQTPVQFQILEEASTKTDGRLKVHAPKMSVADEPTGNGRVYPLAIWSREIKKLQEQIANGGLVGSADHPVDGLSRIRDAAINWTKIWMEGKETHGEGFVIPTAAGKDVEAVIRAGVAVDVSSRAWGSSLKRPWNGKVADVIGEDLDVQSFDLVLGGSVEDSRLVAINEQKILLSKDQLHERRLVGLTCPEPILIQDSLQEFTPEQRRERRLAGLPVRDEQT
jgi:hypothetical protein